MTNAIALVLGALILAAVAANFAAGWGLEVAAGRAIVRAVEWLAFWR